MPCYPLIRSLERQAEASFRRALVPLYARRIVAPAPCCHFTISSFPSDSSNKLGKLTATIMGLELFRSVCTPEAGFAIDCSPPSCSAKSSIKVIATWLKHISYWRKTPLSWITLFVLWFCNVCLCERYSSIHYHISSHLNLASYQTAFQSHSTTCIFGPLFSRLQSRCRAESPPNHSYNYNDPISERISC